MHSAAYDWFASELAILPPRERVVEIGSRNINGSLRSLFVAQTPQPFYIGIDIVPGRNVDVVASGEDYVPPWTPDTVLCAEVLEHVPDRQALAICRNAMRMLGPGGVLLFSMATDPRHPHSASDGGALQLGEFYRNVAPPVILNWLHAHNCPALGCGDGNDLGVVGVRWWCHEHGDLYLRAVKRG